MGPKHGSETFQDTIFGNCVSAGHGGGYTNFLTCLSSLIKNSTASQHFGDKLLVYFFLCIDPIA